MQGYVDGELSPRRMNRVRRHLDQCAGCREALRHLSELKTLLAENRTQPEMDAAPEFFWSQVEARIRGEMQPRQAWEPTFRLNWQRAFAWVGACAATVALTLLVWVHFQPKPQPSQVTLVPAKLPSMLTTDVGAAGSPVTEGPAGVPKVEQITTPGPEIYAEAYHSKKSQATIIWTEGMPVISLGL